MFDPLDDKVKDLATKIKTKHPEYAEVEDGELVNRVTQKFPEYKDYLSADSSSVTPVTPVTPAKPERRKAARSGQITAEEIDGLLNSEHGGKIRNFFGAIKQFEGGQPNLIVGGKQTFDPNGDHPNIVGLRTAQGNSTAAGDYQITGSNWYKNGLKRRLKATNFNPENQLKAALMIFADRDNRAGLNALLNGDLSTAEKIAAKDWAALPSSQLHPKKFDANKLNKFFSSVQKGYTPSQSINAESYGAMPNEPAPEVNITGGEQAPQMMATPENLAKLGINIPAKTKPVTETDYTISQQIQSALKPDSPRTAILLTDEKQKALITPEVSQNFTPVQTPKGLLLVNNQKIAQAGIDSKEKLDQYIFLNGIEPLIGIVEPVADTSKGITVRTEDKDGRELAMHVVTDPMKAVEQLRFHRKEFGDQVGKQSILPTDQATKIRDVEFKTSGSNPFYAPEMKQPDAENLPKEYTEYLKALDAPDSAETRKAYNQLLKDAPESFQQSPKEINQRKMAEKKVSSIAKKVSDTPQTVSGIADQKTGNLDSGKTLSRKVIVPKGVSVRDAIKDATFKMVKEAGIDATGADVQAALDKNPILLSDGTKATDSYLEKFRDEEIPHTLEKSFIADVKTAKKQREQRQNAERASVLSQISKGSSVSPEQEKELAEKGIYLKDIPPDDLNEARIEGEQTKQYRDKLFNQYKNDAEKSAHAQIYAERDAGMISKDAADELIAYEKVIGEQLSKGSENTRDELRLDKEGNIILRKRNEAEIKRAVEEQLEIKRREFGSVKQATLSDAADREEQRQYSKESHPFGQSTEALKTATRYVLKIPATLMDVAAIGTEFNPVTIATDYLKGTDSAEVAKKITAASEDWRKAVDNDLALKQNRVFKNDFVVNEVSEGLAQFATQMILAPLTGGYSLALPLAEGATAQYKDALKGGASKSTRLLAATVGALAGVPDVLLKAKYLQYLTPLEKSSFITKLSRGVFGKLAAKYGEEEAEELTKVTVKSFLKNVGVGFVGETGQEFSEDIINDLVAKATYKPDLNLKDTFLPNEKKIRGYLAAGISGAFGGTVETVTEKMTTDELFQTHRGLDELLAENKISQQFYDDVEKHINTQLDKLAANGKKNQESAGNKPVSQTVQDFIAALPAEEKQQNAQTVQIKQGDSKLDEQIKPDEKTKPSAEVLESPASLDENAILPTNEVKPSVSEKVDEQAPSNKPSGYGVIASDYLLTGGSGSMLSSDYLMQALSGTFLHAGGEIKAITDKYFKEIADSGLGNIKEFVNSELYKKIVAEVRDSIKSSYGKNSAEAHAIFDEILKYPTGLPKKLGQQLSNRLDALHETILQPSEAAEIPANDAAPVVGSTVEAKIGGVIQQAEVTEIKATDGTHDKLKVKLANGQSTVISAKKATVVGLSGLIEENKGSEVSQNSDKDTLPAESNLNEEIPSNSATLASHDAATSPNNDLPEPTAAQIEAGNYKKGHISVNGLDITVENPTGSERKGVDRDGKAWSVEMQHHYGYIKRSIGADKENIDVFVKDHTPEDFSGNVYVIDQVHPDTGEFDEHKVMLGFGSEEEARAAYSANYAKDWKGLKDVTAMPFDEFKTWARGSEQSKPAAENADVKADPKSLIVNPIDRNATQEEKVAQLVKLSDENVPFLQNILQEITDKLGLPLETPNHKKPANILKKANRPSIKAQKPYFDVEHVRDSLRFKNSLNSFDDVKGIADIFRAHKIDIIKVDTDKMTSPKEWGWRFVAFDLRMPNGQLVEYYAPLKELQTKEVKGVNHEIFEKWRGKTQAELDANYDEYVKDVKSSYDRYEAAYETAIKRLGYADAKEAAAAWAKVVRSLSSNTGSNESLSSSGVGMTRDQAPPSSISPIDAPAASVQTNTRPVAESLETIGSDRLTIESNPSISNIHPIGEKSTDISQIGENKLDYGTIEAPNVPNLGRAFAAHFSDGNSFSTIVAARKFAGELLGGKVETGTDLAKRIDEAVEVGVVIAAREIASQNKTEAQKYENLVELYHNQPNLAVRTSTSVTQQAYSTPAPLAFVASRLANIGYNTSVYEPTAGNGMLLIEANPKRIAANELNQDRAKNLFTILGEQVSVTAQNAASFAPEGKFDTIIANPPFGVVKDENETTITFKINQNYKTNEIDHAIVFNALQSMKDDGTAVLIVGGVQGNTDEIRSDKYNGGAKRKFYYSLYNEYNVVDHFTVDGGLYAKQGAGYPVDVIVIHGRGQSNLELPAAAVPRTYKSYKDLGEVLNEQYRKDLLSPANARNISDSADAKISSADGNQNSQKSANGLGNVSSLSSGQSAGISQQNGKPESVGDGRVQIAGDERAGVDAAERRGRKTTDSGQSTAARTSSSNRSASETGSAIVNKPESRDDLSGNESARLADGADRLGDSDGRSLITSTDEADSALDDVFGDLFDYKTEKPAETEKQISSLDEAASVLGDLFGSPVSFKRIEGAENSTSASPENTNLNEATYAKAKPAFIAAYEHFKDKITDVKSFARELVVTLHEQYKFSGESLIAMKPYLSRFITDVQNGILKIGEKVADKIEQAADKITPKEKADISAAQVPYRPASGSYSLETLIPANMQTAVQNALENLQKNVGNVDEYVKNKLGYETTDEMPLSAEARDAIALAVYNIEKGAGFIIGDQTGIGKGRMIAGVIRYAMQSGKTPIFVTEKPNLYADIMRDLRDIGLDNVNPLMTNAGEKIPMNEEGTEFLQSKERNAHNAIMQSVINEGELGAYDILFTTYNQLQTVKGGMRTIRHDIIDALADNSIIIFDESHNAGGNVDTNNKFSKESGMPKLDRATYARQIAKRAKGVFYSSGTFAKRPEVMDLYFKTDISKAVKNLAQLPDVINAGGVPLQQVVSAMLARAGQYLRRERTFAGVEYNTKVAKVDRKMAASVSDVMRAIDDFSKVIKAETDKISEQLKKEAKSVTIDGSVGSAGATSMNFTSLMHNLVNQMLLGLKVPIAAQEAIESLKKGEKPVITLASTMGSFIENYTEEYGIANGDAIDLNFGTLLLRYLERSRDIVEGSPFGQKKRRRLSDEELGESGVAAYKSVIRLVEKTDWSAIPASPIDHIKNEIQKAGFSVGEITGRSQTIDYTDEANPRYKVRPASEIKAAGRTKTISGFNDGSVDAIILNQAGSTGLSLHTSDKFKNQNRRHMIIVQAELNIDTHMQMLGRVHRTGQVITPRYTQLVADVPAEKRPASVLAKKMASLNANTTANKDSALTAKDVPDFMNKYGDEVALALMIDDFELHQKLGSPLDLTGTDTDGAMRKVTGRIPLLPLDEQELVYEALEEAYEDKIRELDAMGENALEAKTYDLDAKTLKSETVFEGSGNSPFTESAMALLVDMKKQGNPFKTSEVIEQLEKSLGRPIDESEIDNLGFVSDGATIARGLMDDAKTRFKSYESEILDNVDEESRQKFNSEKARLEGIRHKFHQLLYSLPIGSAVEVRLANNIVKGIVTKIEQKGNAKNPLALGTWRITVALSDATRQLTIPLSKVVNKEFDNDIPTAVASGKIGIERLYDYNVKLAGGDKLPLLRYFDHARSNAREQRTIVTGNILAGYDKFKSGQIINYTDAEGALQQGILMPKIFNLEKALSDAPVEFAAPEQVVQYLDSISGGQALVTDQNKLLRLSKNNNGSYNIATNAAKATGGFIYLNKNLLSILGRDFVKAGNSMTVSVSDKNTAIEVMRFAAANFEMTFQTVTFKDKAREVTGQDKPAEMGEMSKGFYNANSSPKRAEATTEEFENIKLAPARTLIEKASFEQSGSRLKVNLEGQEFLRRIKEEIDIRAGRKKLGDELVETSFSGIFEDKQHVLATLATLKIYRKEAERAGDETAANFLAELSGKIEDAATAGKGSIVAYMKDSALPHEAFHQAAYLGNSNFLNRHARLSELLKHEAVAAVKTHMLQFAEYRQMKADAPENFDALAVEEAAAYIAGGESHLLKISDDAAADYLVKFFDSYVEKNGVESLDNFEEVSEQIYEQTQKIKTEKGRVSSSGGGLQENNQSDASAESSGDEIASEIGQAQSESDRRLPDESGVSQKLRSLPETLRNAGITAADDLYNVQSDNEAKDSAAQMLSDLGVDGAIKMLNNTVEPDSSHANLAFMVSQSLQNEAAIAEQAGDTEKAASLLKSQGEFTADLARKFTKAGQFISAARVVQNSATATVLSAQKIVQALKGEDAGLNDKDLQKFQELGKQAEEATVKAQELGRKLRNEKAKNKRLTDSIEGKTKRRTRASQMARKQIVEIVKQKHGANVSSLIDDIRAKLLAPISTKRVEGTPSLKRVEGEGIDRATLDQIAQVGAYYLTEGLANKDAEYLPDEFTAQMVATFGDAVKAQITDIHNESLKVRAGWLKAIAFEKRKTSLQNKADSDKGRAELETEIGRIFDDEELSDTDVYEILNVRADLRAKHNAIATIHRITSDFKAEKAEPKKRSGGVFDILSDLIAKKKAGSKDAKAAKDNERILNDVLTKAAGINVRKLNSELDATIAEVAPNAHSAAVAALIAAGARKEEVYSTLERIGVDNKTAKTLFVQGSEALKTAKETVKENHADKIQQLLDAAKIEKDARDAFYQARLQTQRKQQEIADELDRLQKGWVSYVAGGAKDILNLSRTLMASFDLSGALRQGGFFTFSKPELQGKAVANMFKSFSEKGYGRAIMEIEEHPKFTQAQRAGVEFAMAGSHEGNTTEEVFRGDETIKAIPLGIGWLIDKAITGWSERTYTAFLDTQRMTMYNAFASELESAGMTLKSHPADFEKIAEFINIATGKGKMPQNKLGKILTDLPLFAPRYTLSRLQLLNTTLNPVAYYNTPPAARKIIDRAAARFYGTTGLIMIFAAALGAFEMDDDDTDFGKIKVGNTSYDIWVGALQPAKLIWKLVHSAIRTKGGQDNRIAGEFGNDVFDAGIHFVRGKLSPPLSFTWDAITGSDYVGQEFTWGKGFVSRISPLLWQELYNAGQLDGWTGAGKTLISGVGIGVSTFKRPAEKGETEAEKLAQKAAGARFKSVPRTAEETNNRKILSDLTFRSRKGENVLDEVNAAMAAGQITDKQKNDILNAKRKTFLQDKAEGLQLELDKNGNPSGDFMKVYENATPEEKLSLDKLLKTKTDNARKNADAELNPKNLADKLKKADTDKAAELFETFGDNLNDAQKKEFLGKLKMKADSAAAKGKLTEEELQNVRKMLPDYQPKPHRPNRKARPKRGDDPMENLQQIY